jgi:YebC/PmpR family DNA-binding regulatory protein
MAGHSKWAQIKRKKALVDAKKGKMFSRIAKTIELAAQHGADPKINPSLRDAIGEARRVNMPKVNIDRAIKKGSGKERGSGGLEEIYYEAYGPGGVAILVKSLTDNKNRTVAEVKHILNRYGGTLAGAGSVQWQFKETASLFFSKKNTTYNELEETALQGGADDIIEDGDGYLVLGRPSDFTQLRDTFLRKKLNPEVSGIEWRSENCILLSVEDQEALEGLVVALEENDDVQEVFTNAA